MYTNTSTNLLHALDRFGQGNLLMLGHADPMGYLAHLSAAASKPSTNPIVERMARKVAALKVKRAQAASVARKQLAHMDRAVRSIGQ